MEVIYLINEWILKVLLCVSLFPWNFSLESMCHIAVANVCINRPIPQNFVNKNKIGISEFIPHYGDATVMTVFLYARGLIVSNHCSKRLPIIVCSFKIRLLPT